LVKAARLGGKGIDYLLEGANILAAALLVAMLGITCYDVFSRYFFNAPTKWSLELTVYLMIWLGYLAIAYVEKKERHVRVDLLISRFPPRTLAIWEVATSFIFLIFICILIYYGTIFTLESFHAQERSWSMWRPLLWPTKIVIPVGGILLAVYLLRKIAGRIDYIRRTDLYRGSGIFSKPEIMLPAFLALIAICLLLFKTNLLLGMILLMLVLLFGGVPIFPTLGLVGVVGFYLYFGGTNGVWSFFPSVCFESLNNFALACLPLFVLAGQLLQSGGVSEEIYDVASKWVGHFPAGEAIATILACSIFAAISTSSVATALTIGLIALPALAARSYNKNFSYGLLAAGGTLGLMIPPSGTMIIYSAVTEESIGKLFMAGIIPGLILALAFVVYSMLFCSRSKEYERTKPYTWQERLQSTKVGIWGLLTPLIILGGIYSGIFTPLESGAVAALYAIVMVLIRRKIPLKELPKVIGESTLSSVMVLAIIIGALTLGDFMTLTKLPEKALELVSAMGLSPWGVLALIMVIYFLLGMFLEVVSCMLITLPIVYPLITSLGFDGIWFAVIVTINMEMAVLTPPVGLNLFVIQGITKANLIEIVRGVLPFFIIMVLGLILFCIFPELSTWLPGKLVTR